jgi:hypothetical protein
MCSNKKKCRHKFQPRFTSGVAQSQVLSQLATTLLSQEPSEMAWQQFNRVVSEYRKAKLYVGDVCVKCGEKIEHRNTL